MFIYGEMLTENKDYYSFEPWNNLDDWLAKTVNAQSDTTISGIYVL